MRHRCAAMALAACLLSAAAPAVAQTVHVTPLMRDDRVLVSFRLTDVFTEEVRSAIHSGLTVAFVYDVQLKRGVSLWIDRTIAEVTVTATVRYDPLTRRYLLTRREDGRIDKVETVDREETVREWLTEFDRLPLFNAATLESNAEYYVRVRAHTTPRNASFVWPWGGDIAGLAKFTVLK